MLRRTSPSLQRMNRLVIGHGYCCVAIRSAHDDPLVGVGLLNYSAVIHYWPLPHQTNSGGDGRVFTNGKLYVDDDKIMNDPYIRR